MRAVRWEDTKRDIRELEPGWDSPVQARVSQIEHGKITEVDAIRGYVEALGGTVDVIARVGDWTIKVA